jgi:O-antigen/teichoic acid export membrane protein
MGSHRTIEQRFLTPVQTLSSEASFTVQGPSALEQSSTGSLRSRFARGSLWAIVGHLGTQVLRLGGNLVLWRLLYAEAFGLMAIVNVFMQGLVMFSDVGIGPSIIQSKRGDDPRYLNTAWTIQAGRGLALFAVALVAAKPVARFYHQEELASLIPVVGLGSVFMGFNSTKLFTVTRQIALGRLTVIDLFSQALGLVVMLAWAVVTRSIWSLVVGGIACNLAKLAMSHLFLPGISNRIHWDRPSATSLILFGRWIFVSTLLTFAVMQSDRLIFGKLVSMSMLGVYSIATIWAAFPTQILGQVFSSVLFPMLSRVHNSQGDVAAAYREARAPWLIAAGWLAACLISGGPVLIRFLYDERALEAGFIVQVLSVGSWFLALEMSNGSALLAEGKPKWVAAAGAAKLCAMVVLIPAGMMLAGFRGAVIGFAASELFRYGTALLGGMSSKLRGYTQDLFLSIVIAATSLLGVAIGRAAFDLVTRMIPGHHPRAIAFFEGGAIFTGVTAVWAVLYVGVKRRAPYLASVFLK